MTVAELIDILAKFPSNLPVGNIYGEPVEVITRPFRVVDDTIGYVEIS